MMNIKTKKGIKNVSRYHFEKLQHAVLRQRLTHFNSAQNLKMCQSLTSHFLTAFSRIVLVQKLRIINFGDTLKSFFTGGDRLTVYR